ATTCRPAGVASKRSGASVPWADSSRTGRSRSRMGHLGGRVSGLVYVSRKDKPPLSPPDRGEGEEIAGHAGLWQLQGAEGQPALALRDRQGPGRIQPVHLQSAKVL